MSLTTCAMTAVLFARLPLGGLPTQQCLHELERPQVSPVESRDFLRGVNVHLRDPFATRWAPPGAREPGAGVTYHVPLTEIELFAEGRRLWWQQGYGGGVVRTPFDVVYSAGLSFRLPF